MNNFTNFRKNQNMSFYNSQESTNNDIDNIMDNNHLDIHNS